MSTTFFSIFRTVLADTLRLGEEGYCLVECPKLLKNAEPRGCHMSDENLETESVAEVGQENQEVEHPPTGSDYEPEYYTGDDGYTDSIRGDVEAFDIPSDWHPNYECDYVPTEAGDKSHDVKSSKAPHGQHTVENPSPVPVEEREKDPYLFAHLADLHLAPRSGTITKRDAKTGRLVRDLDMTSALRRAVDDILAQDPLPSACVIAGDIFDTFQGSQDAIIDAAREFKRVRQAGIAIVAIAGNHDTPTQKQKTPAYVVLKHEFADIAEDNEAYFAYDEIEHVKVGDVEYVLLPHNAACAGNFTEDDFAPCLGASKSVLVVHGVAAGDPSLAQMDEMKEIPIAKWILDMGWDYVAFGHYHKPGWIPGYRGRAAYCGSLENTVISGPDVCHTRGPVYVDVEKDGTDKLVMHPQRIRPIISLPDIDVEGRDVNAEELDREIAETILAAETDGCIVLHSIKNVPRSVVKTMSRRSFQAVNPEMLFIKTKIEYLSEVPKAVNLNSEQEEETGAGTEQGAEGDAVEVRADRNFKPLNVEVSEALEALISDGTIRESRRENVQKILDEVFENR